MAYYTEDPIENVGLSILDAPTTFGEAVGAAAEQSFSGSITPLIIQSDRLREQEQGRRYYNRTTGLQINAPESELLSHDQATEQVKQSGLDVDVPDGGIRQGTLDMLMSRRQAERERSILMQNAPSSAAPAMLIASFAAQAVDPINIASAFIPVVGEARYGAMLGAVTGVAGRLGVRAGVGALEGAVGAAVLEPAVYTLSQQLQDDYDITDSLTNIAFGAVLGGSLRGIGGIIKDRFAPDTRIDIGDSLDDMPAPDKATLARAGYIDDSYTALRRDLETGLQAERLNQSAAVDNLMPTFRAELQQAAEGRISNVADMRAELDSVNKRIASLPDTFRQRAKDFQDQGYSRKEAERAARDAISQETENLKSRKAEVEDAVEGNRQAELARSDLQRLDRGEIPERFKDRIASESSRISQGMTKTALADAVQPISFADKSELFRNSLGAAFNGLDISPRTFLDLKSPDANIRQQAIDHIKNAPRRTPRDYQIVSDRANADIRMTPKEDMAFQDSQLQADEASAKEVADQTGYNLKDDPELKEAERFEKEVSAYQDVYRANALCMMRG